MLAKRVFYFSFLVLLLLAPASVTGQETDYAGLHQSILRGAIDYEKDHGLLNFVLAEAYYKMAMISFRQKNYLQAKTEFEKELSIRQQLSDTGTNKVKLIKANYNVIVLYQQLGKYKEAMPLALGYLNLVLAYYGTLHSETVDAYQLLAGLSHQLHRLVPQERYTTKAIDVLGKLPTVDSSKLINLLILKAGGYIELGDYEYGNELLMEVLDIVKKSKNLNPTLIAKLYNNIGSLRDSQHQSAEALDYFRKAFTLRIKTGEDRHPGLIWIYDNMGVIHQKMKHYSVSNEYFQKAMQLSTEVLGANHPKTAEIIGHLGAAMQKQGELDSALYYYQLAERSFQQSIGTDCLEQTFVLQKIIEIYISKSKYHKAWLLCSKVERILKKNHGTKHPDLAVLYLNMASYAIERQDTGTCQSLLAACYKANHIVGDDSTTIYVLDKMLYFKYLSTWLMQLPPLSQDDEIEFKIAVGIKNALELTHNTNSITDKTIVLEATHKMYGAILAYYASKGQDANLTENIWEKAFYIMELSKSVLLSEQLSADQQLKRLPISDVDKALYKRAKSYTRYFEKQWLHSELENKPNDIQYFYEQFEYYKKQRDSLKKQFRTEFPKTAVFEANIHPVLISTLRKQLREGEVLLSYAINENGIFLLGLTRDKFLFETKSLDILEELYELLPNFFVPNYVEEDWQRSFESFVGSFSTLSEKILPDFQFMKGCSRLTVLPDGVLNYLPFELLLMKSNEKASHFSALPFLLKSFAVRYAYSFNTSLMHVKKRNEAGFLGLAPHYDGRNPTYPPLRAAKAELKALQEKYEGVFISDKLIQKADFMDYMSSASIIHLAAHAFAPDSTEAYLALSSKENNTNLDQTKVMMYEFAAHHFEKVDLVVLSACQTGLGQFKKGEGVMSLGRGFAYAGVPAVLVTLWPLHDKSAEKLMLGFYEYLEQGLEKDEALRQSKLDFLSSAGRLNSHPLYWAAPVLWGNTTAIYLTKTTYSKKWCYIWVGAISFSLVFIIVTLIYIKRKIKIVN